MTNVTIDYAKAIESLRSVRKRKPTTTAIHVRLPVAVVEGMDSIAEQNNISRSVIVRNALMDYFNKMAEQQA